MDNNALIKEIQDLELGLEENQIKILVRRYNKMIDNLTFNRIDYEDEKLVELVHNCIVDLVVINSENMALRNTMTQTNGLKSATTDKVSETYQTMSVEDSNKLADSLRELEYNTIKIYFGDTGLMYRGITRK